MSRSRKKTLMGGWSCAESERKDKDIWHRRFRRAIRQRIGAVFGADGHGLDVLPHFRELSDPWAMAKDDKRRFRKPAEAPDDPGDVGGSRWLRRMFSK